MKVRQDKAEIDQNNLYGNLNNYVQNNMNILRKRKKKDKIFSDTRFIKKEKEDAKFEIMKNRIRAQQEE